MEKHYSLSKAADLLGVTTQTLRNWDNAGKIITARTPGNQRRIPESEIMRLLTPKAGAAMKSEHKPIRSTSEKEVNSNQSAFILVNKENYILMCKDTAVYNITTDEILDKNLLPGCIQKNTMSYRQWMETRYSKDTNFSSRRLIHRTYGTYDHEQAKLTTGALSLSDCYWIKSQDEEVLFNDITPYNEFNPLANLFVSGSMDKQWIDSQTLLKLNTYWEIEPFALCSAIGLRNTAEAHLTDNGIILSNFTSPDAYYESMEQFGIKEERADPRETAIQTFKEPAVALFVIDYLVENNDRHPDDYGSLRSTKTGEYISMAPYHNFDRIWTGEVITLPDIVWQEHRDYIHDLCRKAIGVSNDFEYGTIIERRAAELLQQ